MLEEITPEYLLQDQISLMQNELQIVKKKKEDEIAKRQLVDDYITKLTAEIIQ